MGESEKVMVVDDDLMSVMEAEEVLEEDGYEVIRLSSPSGALSKIDFEQPDALLVDITMDRLDAEDVIDTLRNSPDHRGVVIVVYSDMEVADLEEYCHDNEVNGYFQKSMDATQITEFLDEFF